MTESRDNSVEISGNGSNSPVTVHQNQDGNQSISEKHIEYVVDDSTVRVFPRAPAEKMNALFVGTLCVSALGIIADMAEILSYVGIHTGFSLLVFAPICLVIALVTKKDRWLTSLPEDDSASFYGGLWYEKVDEKNFASYLKRAKCVYPSCEGLVNIVPAPPREQPNHTLVGKCSVGGVRHTYSVDYNGIGYPKQFDWRPVEN